MSLRFEQYNALLRTRDFMRELLTMRKKDLVSQSWREFRLSVYSCLKHFPPLDKHGQPYWSQDEFTEDRKNGQDST